MLANENFPADAVKALRERGNDVLWVRETHPGITDEKVLALAIAENRVLVTFDKDFGELAFRSKLPATTGIILFRIRKRSPAFVVQRAIESLASRTEWAGYFSVVEEDRLRVTRLPSADQQG